MRVCEEISKRQHPALIHPSDKKYTKLKQKIASLLIQIVIRQESSVSSYTIRAVQNAIITGMSLVDLMRALMARSWVGDWEH